MATRFDEFGIVDEPQKIPLCCISVAVIESYRERFDGDVLGVAFFLSPFDMIWVRHGVMHDLFASGNVIKGWGNRISVGSYSEKNM